MKTNKVLSLIAAMVLIFSQTNAQTWHDLDSIAVDAYTKADYKTAIEWDTKALAKAEVEFGKNDSNYASCLSNIGVFYVALGDNEKGEFYIKQALEINKNVLGENHPNYIECLNNLSQVYYNLGDYIKTESLIKQVIELNRKLSGESNLALANYLHNLAGLYSDIGNYKKAEPILIQVSEIYKNILGENHPEYANNLNNLGNVYSQIGDFTKAELLFIQSLEINRKVLGENHPKFATSLNNLGNLYFQIGDFTKAEPLFIQSLKIFRKVLGENHSSYAMCLHNLSKLYINLGDYAKAESYIKQSLEISKKTLEENHPDFVLSLNTLASLYALISNYHKAEKLYDTTHHILLHNIIKNYSFLSEQEKEKYNNTVFQYFNEYCGFVYRNYMRLPASITHGYNNKLATNSLLRKSDVAMKYDINTSNDRALQNRYSDWIELKKQIATASNQSIAARKNRSINLDSLEEQANTLEKELVGKSAAFADQNIKEIDYVQLKHALNKDEAAIEFASFKYHNGKKLTDSFVYVVYIVKKGDTVPVYIPLFEQKELQLLLSSVGVAGRGATIANDEIRNENLYKELYNLVWKKIEPCLKGIKTVYISPSGSLNKISFESLQNEAGVSLINKYQIHHLVSSGDLIALKANKKPITNKNIALFGGAVFDLNAKALQQLANKDNKTNDVVELYASRGEQRNGPASLPWNYLPGTLEEVKTISTTLKESNWNVRLDTGITATEEQLKALSGNSPEILHIATHGFYLPARKDTSNHTTDDINIYNFAQNPMLRSGIILTGANTKWVEDKDIPNTDNGVVTALDISNLDFTKTSLVVLSACQTGLGDVQSREGVYGLQRAFLLAGVKNALISLWSVPDKETAQMMELFYANLASGKVSYYEAFNKAQKTMQKLYAREPLLWAGFELVGE